MGNKIPPRKHHAFVTKKAARGPTHSGPIGRAKILSTHQINMALEAAPQYAMYGERDRLFVMLSHLAGLRAQEIARLHVEDITDVQGNFVDILSVHKRGAKYGKEREIDMDPDLKAALIDYIKKAKIESGPIFWTQRGVPMTSNAVQKQLKACYTSCGFKGARSHSGRRYAITAMARQANTVGASLKDVMIFAGHADLATTETYIDRSPHGAKLIGLLSLKTKDSQNAEL